MQRPSIFRGLSNETKKRPSKIWQENKAGEWSPKSQEKRVRKMRVVNVVKTENKTVIKE